MSLTSIRFSHIYGSVIGSGIKKISHILQEDKMNIRDNNTKKREGIL